MWFNYVKVGGINCSFTGLLNFLKMHTCRAVKFQFTQIFTITMIYQLIPNFLKLNYYMLKKDKKVKYYSGRNRGIFT